MRHALHDQLGPTISLSERGRRVCLRPRWIGSSRSSPQAGLPSNTGPAVGHLPRASYTVRPVSKRTRGIDLPSHSSRHYRVYTTVCPSARPVPSLQTKCASRLTSVSKSVGFSMTTLPARVNQYSEWQREQGSNIKRCIYEREGTENSVKCELQHIPKWKQVTEATSECHLHPLWSRYRYNLSGIWSGVTHRGK